MDNKIMKLIDKDTLMAEIDRLENKLYYEPENFKDVGAKMALDSLKSFLDTLEVKEVDLDKEINLWFDYGLPNDDEFLDYIKETAKHFFELGLKAQKDSELTQKDISIIYGLVIDAVYEQMRCKNPSFEGKDIYQEVLKRFKALKGE